MAETIESPQEQTQSGLDRLSQDPEYVWGDNQPEIKTETPKDETVELEKPAAETTEKVEPTPEDVVKTETQEVVEAAKEVVDEGFKEESVVESNDTWKAYLEANEIPIPEDFSEEKGFEIVLQAKEAEKLAAIEEIKSIKEVELFSSLPDNTRAEAQLIVDLLKTGQTLEQIMQPFQQIKEWKSMTKEQLVRQKYEAKEGYDAEMVDKRMAEIEADKSIDIEYKIVMATVKEIEQNLNASHQQQIKQRNDLQNRTLEQKRTQELSSIKAALDKMPTFMDRKLSDENKQSVLRDIGQFENASAQDKAEYMLWKKYGKQGLKDLQARATEKATLEKAKTQHNVPITPAGGNAREATTQHKTGIDRVLNDPNFA